MNWTLKKVLTYDVNFSIDTDINKVIITFNTNVLLPTLKYKIVEIYAQIGPGWVE